LPGSTPKVAAMAYWARALGHARAAVPTSADPDIAALNTCRDQLTASGDAYWAAQTDVLLKSAQAWSLRRGGDNAGAVASLRAAADEEDELEKLPVTPGPIVPAREQLAELLLQLHRPDQALREFKADLALAPGRRAALVGAMAAAQEAGDAGEARTFRSRLLAERLDTAP
jgi:hypothetical protein